MAIYHLTIVKSLLMSSDLIITIANVTIQALELGHLTDEADTQQRAVYLPNSGIH